MYKQMENYISQKKKMAVQCSIDVIDSAVDSIWRAAVLQARNEVMLSLNLSNTIDSTAATVDMHLKQRRARESDVQRTHENTLSREERRSHHTDRE